MEGSTDLGIADCDESKPLLEEDVKVQKPVTNHIRSTRDVTIRCVILCGAFCLQVISYVIIHTSVLTQYAYFAMEKEYFSNVTFNTTEPERSNCKNVSSSTLEKDNEVQSIASEFLIYTTLALFVPCMLANFFFATLSDSYGRKPFMIVSVAGSFFRNLLFCIGIYYDINIYFFILFVFVEGISGGIFFMVPLSQSYIADITEPGKNRVLLIAIIEVVSGFGGLIGSISSGYLIKSFGYLMPCFISTCFSFLAAVMLLLCLPESLSPEDQSKGKTLKICQKLKGVATFYSKETGKGKRWRYIICLIILFCVGYTTHGRTGVESLYQLHAPFCWTSVPLGWYLALRIFFSYVVGVSLIRVLQWCFSDELISIFGTVSILTSFLLEAFAETNVQLILVPVVGFGSALVGPLVRVIMSRMTPTDKQGTLFAGIGTSEALCMIIGSTLSNVIYSATVQTTRGFVFLVFSGITGVALVLLIILWLGNCLTKDNSRFIYQEIDVETKKRIKGRQFLSTFSMLDEHL